MRLAGHQTRKGIILFGKPQRKRTHGRAGLRYEYNIKTNLREILEKI
jgi:hypothetical protein